ncbi:CHAT domain-containing protein [Ilyonectria robusta]|uniref:CHAT domain-containing protein n=1 Tax=Ilyonectria robusta TaxID=1079257 RepID=UPI001E8E8F89|nr:CHAT domain-containing protein [Ilyonectria robusta]KAH8721649.1 CHAT domain-containing protein [Ilyonectria robusta]
MAPIMDALGFTKTPLVDDWPHVWWIPTGPLKHFPLHAAGYHSKFSAETVLDRVMSSYISSIKAITHGRQRQLQPSTSDKALLVAMEHTPNSSRLPFAKDEVSMLRKLSESMALDPIEPERRKADIMSHLWNCKIFHFSGHGYTDKTNTWKSQLLLEDWKDDPFTVADLLEMNLRDRSPFLAYLSACGTSQIKDSRSVDEGMNLINAYQLAGFRHVIGTLWEVNDELCVDMGKLTYEGLRDGGMTDKSVCQGLHRATRRLRDSWAGVYTNDRAEDSVVESSRPLGEKGTTSKGAGCQGSGGVRIARDATVCDFNEPEIAHWVPYVHYGI